MAYASFELCLVGLHRLRQAKLSDVVRLLQSSIRYSLCSMVVAGQRMVEVVHYEWCELDGV